MCSRSGPPHSSAPSWARSRTAPVSRPLLIGANLALAVLLPALLAVDAPDRLWILFAVLLVYGAAGVVHDAAESALVAAVVDRSLLGDFNGLRMTANEGMKLVAPLARAALYAAYGGARVALLDAVTFALAAGVCALLRVGKRRPPGRRDLAVPDGHGRAVRPGAPGTPAAGLVSGTTMLFAGLNGALIYAVVEALGHSPRTPGSSTPSRAPVRY